MGLNDLKEVIEKLQGRITNHEDYLQKEPRTRTLLVDPLLRELGWDVEDPHLVELEYEPESTKRMSADYILKNGKKQVAIVEAKPIGKTIEDLGVLEQAEKYASSAGAPFIILTNGVKWLLYKRSSTASLASLNPIVSFDIEHDEPYYCASTCVSMWLPNLSSGCPKNAVTPVPPDDKMKDDPAVPPKPALAIKKDFANTKELYLAYWTAFRKHLEEHNGVIKPIAPNKGHWLYFSPFGDSRFRLGVTASVKGKFIRVRFIFWGKNAKGHFNSFKQDRNTIEKAIDPKLAWNEKPNKKESDIELILSDGNPINRGDWNRQHQWLGDKLELFYEVFSERIEAL